MLVHGTCARSRFWKLDRDALVAWGHTSKVGLVNCQCCKTTIISADPGHGLKHAGIPTGSPCGAAASHAHMMALRLGREMEALLSTTRPETKWQLHHLAYLVHWDVHSSGHNARPCRGAHDVQRLKPESDGHDQVWKIVKEFNRCWS